MRYPRVAFADSVNPGLEGTTPLALISPPDIENSGEPAALSNESYPKNLETDQVVPFAPFASRIVGETYLPDAKINGTATPVYLDNRE